MLLLAHVDSRWMHAYVHLDTFFKRYISENTSEDIYLSI
jgi:hypothetical protein